MQTLLGCHFQTGPVLQEHNCQQNADAASLTPSQYWMENSGINQHAATIRSAHEVHMAVPLLALQTLKRARCGLQQTLLHSST